MTDVILQNVPLSLHQRTQALVIHSTAAAANALVHGDYTMIAPVGPAYQGCGHAFETYNMSFYLYQRPQSTASMMAEVESVPCLCSCCCPTLATRCHAKGNDRTSLGPRTIPV